MKTIEPIHVFMVKVSYQRVSDAAAMAKAAIGVAPAIFPALGVQFLPGDTICSNACANWVPWLYTQQFNIHPNSLTLT